MAPSETETLRAQAAAELAQAWQARDAAMDRARAAEAETVARAQEAARAAIRETRALHAAETAASLLWAMPDGTPHRQAALDALLAVLPDDTDPDGEDWPCRTARALGVEGQP